MKLMAEKLGNHNKYLTPFWSKQNSCVPGGAFCVFLMPPVQILTGLSSVLTDVRDLPESF
jgi:hypothetical protein